MVTTASLQPSDKAQIITSLKQGVASVLAITIVVAFLSAALALIFDLGLPLLLVIAGITFSAFIVSFCMLLLSPLTDLKSNVKQVHSAVVKAKKVQDNWAWHGHVVADLVAQPKLTTYELVLADRTVTVSEAFFKSTKEGEIIVLHYSRSGSTLLAVNKA